MGLAIQVTSSLADVDVTAYNGLDHGGSPFLEHGFLRALEISGSVGPRTGWEPFYILATWVGRPGAPAALVGAVPCYLKSHSYGEYIFDFGWARAAQQGGLEYYPKLVVAAPMTPATGPRILLPREHVDDRPARDEIARALVAGVRELADRLEVSSIHWLFTTAAEQALLDEVGFLPRASFQYHFHNPGYGDFETFLASLTSRKRKSIRKERARAVEGLEVGFVEGDEIGATELDAMDRFYRATCRNHGGTAYLGRRFFHVLHELAPERVRMCVARRGSEIVASALYLETERALYGRYWGCGEHIELLHFELAYYQGIERCIARGLPLFEAGAQGEHKLLRGFVPSPTYSSHWIRHQGLRHAVARFLAQERVELEHVARELSELEPYRQG